MKCRVLNFDLVDYEEAHAIQNRIVTAVRRKEACNTLIFLEHPKVFTLGRQGSLEHLLCSKNILDECNIKVKKVDRGGDITFHGEGQLVVYPIFDLREYKCDLHKYLRSLEEVVINSLRAYGICSGRQNGLTGVWVEDRKIASIGIGAKDWITYHGLSLNVNVDLKFFSLINPCGLKDVKMTSLKEILGVEVPMDDVKLHVASEFEKTFGVEILN